MVGDTMSDRSLAVVVIYRRPLDHPNHYVVRRQWVGPGGQIAIDPEPLAVVDDLERARDAVPAQHDWNIGRQPEDDPVIVECWI